jgi:hypothetical protein
VSSRPARLVLLLALTLCLSGVAAAPALAQGAQPVSQRITIESPAPGTQVGSPLTVTGSLATLPSNAQLFYIVQAGDGRVLGSGSFPIPGSPGQPAFFIASLSFAEPLEGGGVTLQLMEQDAATGGLVAVANLPLVTAPVPQRIIIESPGSEAQVGNPVVVTGRTVRYPASGVLGYAIYNGGGVQVGGGVFGVSGSPLEGGRFAASLPFVYPELGGLLRIDLYDQDPLNGIFHATARVETRTLALRQQVTIETPSFGTRVGSPVVITGFTARYPAAGLLQFRLSDSRGTTLVEGSFPVQPASGGTSRFVTSITFPAPAAPGTIRAEIFEPGQAGGAFVDLTWGTP